MVRKSTRLFLPVILDGQSFPGRIFVGVCANVFGSSGGPVVSASLVALSYSIF